MFCVHQSNHIVQNLRSNLKKMFLLIPNHLCVLLIIVELSVAIMNRDSMAIDVNDILSEKLMPMSILYLEGTTKNSNDTIDEANFLNNITSNLRSSFVGDIDSAISLMNFHRKMIHNYKCSRYLAKQILMDVAPYKLQNRIGMSSNIISDSSDGEQSSEVL